MFDWTDPPRAGQRLLDIGCAGGNPQARDLACTVIGLDEDPAVRPTVVGSAIEMPFDSASFDYVICHHVLEHIAAPKRALHEVARVLKPDGGLSIAVPDGRGLCDGIYRYLFEGGGHVNRFRRPEIVELVERTTSLRLVRWRKLYSSFSYLSTMLPLLDVPPPDLQARLRRLRHVPKRAIRAAHAALYLGSRLFGDGLYGWAFYFERSAGDPVELPAMVNVCVHCGTGSPSSTLRRLGHFTALCPSCNSRTLYFPPFGGRV
jgi:SAM-dependent methyltransferase